MRPGLEALVADKSHLGFLCAGGVEPVVGETVVQKTVELDIAEIAARKVEEVGRLR